MADDWRAQRLARNEVRFREINERLEQDLADLGVAGLQEFVCECGDRDCSEIVPLALDEYERARSQANWFVVVPGHVYPAVEQVVERRDRFELIEKLGATAEIATSTDPRG